MGKFSKMMSAAGEPEPMPGRQPDEVGGMDADSMASMPGHVSERIREAISAEQMRASQTRATRSVSDSASSMGVGARVGSMAAGDSIGQGLSQEAAGLDVGASVSPAVENDGDSVSGMSADAGAAVGGITAGLDPKSKTPETGRGIETGAKFDRAFDPSRHEKDSSMSDIGESLRARVADVMPHADLDKDKDNGRQMDV